MEYTRQGVLQADEATPRQMGHDVEADRVLVQLEELEG